MRFRCGHCQQPMEVPHEATGGVYLCPSCGRQVRVTVVADENAPIPLTPETKSEAVQRPEPEIDSLDTVDTVRIAREEGDEEEDLDMTPMVDVTFLLLIFFMITASFALQKSLEIPPPEREESSTQSRTVEEIEQDDDFVIVRIAKDDTVWVDDREAPSEQDLLVKLREARQGGAPGQRAPSSLLVLADRECRHKTVVMALDAGNSVGFEHPRLATVDDTDF